MSNILILASSSPQRLSLLRQIGIEPNKVIASNIDETPKKNETPKQVAYRLAYEKAVNIYEQGNKENYIIAGDTLVAVGRRILGKPENEVEAKKHLSLLSGRRHRVFGGICVITPLGKVIRRIIETQVIFKKLSEQDIKFAIEIKEWEGRSGGYSIGGKSGIFIKEIHGSYPNVVGIDVYSVYNILLGEGYIFNKST